MKADLEREVTSDEAVREAAKFGCAFMETR
jgi:hypothetical protein